MSSHTFDQSQAIRLPSKNPDVDLLEYTAVQVPFCSVCLTQFNPPEYFINSAFQIWTKCKVLSGKKKKDKKTLRYFPNSLLPLAWLQEISAYTISEFLHGHKLGISQPHSPLLTLRCILVAWGGVAWGGFKTPPGDVSFGGWWNSCSTAYYGKSSSCLSCSWVEHRWAQGW